MVSNSRGENKGMAQLFVFGFFFFGGGMKENGKREEDKCSLKWNELEITSTFYSQTGWVHFRHTRV